MCLTKIVPTHEGAVVKGFKVFLADEHGLVFDTMSTGKYLKPGICYKDNKTKKIRTTAVDHDDTAWSQWSEQTYLTGYHFFLKKEDAIWYADNKQKVMASYLSAPFEVWQCDFSNITAVGVQENRPYWAPGSEYPKTLSHVAATARTMLIQKLVHKTKAV